MRITAKEFAKAFYNSKAWQKCRASYIAERVMIDGGLCETCHEKPGEELHHDKEIDITNIDNSEITLNHENLKWLCKDCHFAVHKQRIMEGFERKKAKPILTSGHWFDSKGEIHPQERLIVYGSPASGKSTYVRKHKSYGDLVLDLDLIKQAISMSSKTDAPNNLISVALEIRETIYRLIENNSVDSKHVWIIGALPNKKERDDLARRLNAQLLFMDCNYDECISRANQDKKRKDKLKQEWLIKKWFESYQP